MIDENTPYKLAEIIRDTWPQLYHLKRDDIENQQGFQVKTTYGRCASAPVIARVLNKVETIENQ
jgi:hypothetical protein